MPKIRLAGGQLDGKTIEINRCEKGKYVFDFIDRQDGTEPWPLLEQNGILANCGATAEFAATRAWGAKILRYRLTDRRTRLLRRPIYELEAELAPQVGQMTGGHWGVFADERASS